MSHMSRRPARFLVSETEAVILGEGVISGGATNKPLRKAQIGIAEQGKAVLDKNDKDH